MDDSDSSGNSTLTDSKKDSTVERILASLKSYYNINFIDGVPNLVARCDYFEKSERFMVSKKANLWSANSEEFIYLFYVQNLTSKIYDECITYVSNSWQKVANIGPNHMYTYVTPIFVCDGFEDEALKKLRRCRIYKSFKLSFHGWMEYHCVLVCKKEIFSNGRGRGVRKMLQKVIQHAS